MLGKIQKVIIRNAIENHNIIEMKDFARFYGRKTNFNQSASNKAKNEWFKWLEMEYIHKINNHYEVTNIAIKEVINEKEVITMKNEKYAQNANNEEIDPMAAQMNKQMKNML